MKIFSVPFLVLIVSSLSLLPQYAYQARACQPPPKSTKNYKPYYHPGGCKIKAVKPKSQIIWEALTLEDKRVNAEIAKAQIDFGVSSKEAGKLIFDHAKNYYQKKQYLKAKILLDKLTRVNKMYKGIPGINIAEVYTLRSKVYYSMGHHSKQYPIAQTPSRTPTSIQLKYKKDNLKTKNIKLISKSLSPETGSQSYFLKSLSDKSDQK